MMLFNLLRKFHVMQMDTDIPSYDFFALAFNFDKLRHFYGTPPQKISELMKDGNVLFDEMHLMVAYYYFLQLSRTLGLDLSCWRRRVFLEYLILVVACFVRNRMYGCRGFRLSKSLIDVLEAEEFNCEDSFTFYPDYSDAAISRMMQMVRDVPESQDYLRNNLFCKEYNLQPMVFYWVLDLGIEMKSDEDPGKSHRVLMHQELPHSPKILIKLE